MDRTTLITGPAKHAFAGATFFSSADVKANLDLNTFKVRTSAHGVFDERVDDWTPTVEIPLDGRWNASLISALWGFYANMAVGTSIFTGTDVPLTMTSASDTHTLVAAACTKLPDIVLSATKTMLGSATFTGVPGKGKTWVDSASVYTVGAGAAITDTAFDPQQIITQPYTGVFGTQAGLTSFTTEDGWTISFDLELQPIKLDAIGTIDIRFKSLSIMAKCVPIEATAAQLLASLSMQTAGAYRGRSLAASAQSLTITGLSNGVDVCTIPAAAIKGAGFRFGDTVLRQGEIGFVGVRTFTTGAQNALFTLAAS